MIETRTKKQDKKMKTNTAQTDSTSQAFLTGTILFANLDYSALEAYALKAVIGGVIWMVFKLAGDYLSAKLLNRKGLNKDKKDDTPTSSVGE